MVCCLDTININKTHVLTLNFNSPNEIRNLYNWKWEAESIKYLGVTITKDFDANNFKDKIQIKYKDGMLFPF